MLDALRATDPDVYDAVVAEANRQHGTLELIASENFASAAVIETAGTVLTNKYAEGYPGKRYYGGCEFVDIAESLAISRARRRTAPSRARSRATRRRPRTRSRRSTACRDTLRRTCW